MYCGHNIQYNYTKNICNPEEIPIVSNLVFTDPCGKSTTITRDNCNKVKLSRELCTGDTDDFVI